MGAAEYGLAGPAWLIVLQLADAWKTPPWEIVRAPASLLWASRLAAWRAAQRGAVDTPSPDEDAWQQF